MNGQWIDIKAHDGGGFGAYMSTPPKARGPASSSSRKSGASTSTFVTLLTSTPWMASPCSPRTCSGASSRVSIWATTISIRQRHLPT